MNRTIAFIMKVFKNLFGRGDKIHVDEIAVAPGLLLGGAVIVDSGSGANGSWVKWGNGYARCWLNIYHSSISFVSSGSIYRTATQYFNFPITFLENPTPPAVVVDCTGNINWTSLADGAAHLYLTGGSYRIFRSMSTNPVPVRVLIGAEGWWKEPGT